jgi:predicted ribosome quality control (RQC) complex YloA/Tae2 family protein
LRKKEITSFDIAAAIHELKGTIANSRVNNIHQQSEKTLVFKLHKIDQPPIRLVMEAGRRLHLTSYAQENPAEPPAFCMALRRNLRGAWLVGIDQYEFERIVTVTFKTKDILFKLVVELFGEGNIILTDEKNRIMQALEFKKMRDRNILRNETLVVPPPSGKNPFKVTQPELQEALKAAGETEVVRSVARLLGLGGVYAEEMLLRANVDKTAQCKNLTEEQINAIYSALQSLLTPLSESKLEPAIILAEDDSFMDCVPLKLKRYEGCKTQTYPTFNQALDEFYLRTTATETAIASLPQVDKLQKEAERLRRMVADQEKSVAEEDRKAERDKIIGDTIYVHYNELQSFAELLLKANNQGKDWSDIIAQVTAAKKTGKAPAVYFEGFDGKNLALNLFVDDLHFSYNLRDSLFDNANAYYEKGKRAKQKIAGALSALQDSKKNLAETEKDLAEAEKLKSLKISSGTKNSAGSPAQRAFWLLQAKTP